MATSELSFRPVGLAELVGDDAGHRVAGGSQAGRNQVVLPISIVTAIVSPSARPSAST